MSTLKSANVKEIMKTLLRSVLQPLKAIVCDFDNTLINDYTLLS